MRLVPLQRLAALAAVAGVLAPHSAIAGPPKTSDVVLRQGDVFVGQVVGPRGEAIAGAPVSVHHNGVRVAHATTNKQGVFAVRGIRTGVHQVAAAGGQANYRLWSPQAAPPTAQSAGMVVANAPVASGQAALGALAGVSTTTVVGTTAAVAGGVLLWTEVIDDDDDPPPASP